jgi:ATP-dependent Lon protease
MASIHGQIEQYVNSGASVPPEVAVAARNIVDGGLLADMTAYSPEMTTEQRQELLETIDVADRLRLASQFLAKQIEVLELKGRIQSEVKSEMDKTQREYILREQMKAIQKELGEDDPAVAEASELREKVEQSAMPDEVKERALKEVDRLARIPSASPEQGVIRTYVDWLVSLPWGVVTDDNLDLDDAEKILNEASRRSRSESSSTWPCASWPTRSARRSCCSSARPASARRASASRSPAPWAASSCA